MNHSIWLNEFGSTNHCLSSWTNRGRSELGWWSVHSDQLERLAEAEACVMNRLIICRTFSKIANMEVLFSKKLW